MCAAWFGGLPANPGQIPKLCVLRGHFDNRWINIILSAVLTSQGRTRKYKDTDTVNNLAPKIIKPFPEAEFEVSPSEERQREQATNYQNSNIWEDGRHKKQRTSPTASAWTSLSCYQDDSSDLLSQHQK